MPLSTYKIRELELFAKKLSTEPDKLLDALISFAFVKPEPIKLLTPEEKVKAIEEEALNKGWTYEQLWATPNNTDYSKKGLIYFVDDETTIAEVTEKHIASIHERIIGGPIINNFYNMKVEQPWIKKFVSEESKDLVDANQNSPNC